jgi:predicted N-acetyltransferase YhbS
MTEVVYALERAEDMAEIEQLLDLALGSDRFTKTAYRLREGVAPAADLCLVAREDGTLRASVRFWPVLIGDRRLPALLLGPLAVDGAHRGRGIGIGIMRRGLDLARAAGHCRVILVGDEPYYARVGFSREVAVGLDLPGPVDPRRLLGLALVPGAFDGVAGMVHRALPEDAPVAVSAPLAQPGRQ